MFELSVACKYLLPRWRQLSVSIISIISILVISLVVWLIVVFFSVTNGLEKGWTHKLITLTAPVRITPTEAYYNSYYYQVDSVSSASNYSLKSIGEKLASTLTDPYNPDSDEEIPTLWQAPDLEADGSVKDIVKKTFNSIKEIKSVPGLTARDFEVTFANLRLRLQRDSQSLMAGTGVATQNQSTLSHPIWLGSFDPTNVSITQAMLPIRMDDLRNILNLLAVSTDNIREDIPQGISKVNHSAFQQRLKGFFNDVEVTQLKTPVSGWAIPKSLLPEKANYQVCAVLRGNEIIRIVIPQEINQLNGVVEKLEASGLKVSLGTLNIDQKNYTLSLLGSEPRKLARTVPISLPGGILIGASLLPDSLSIARSPSNIKFHVNVAIQNVNLTGDISLSSLDFGKAKISTDFKDKPQNPPQWLYHVQGENKDSAVAVLEGNEAIGEGVLLPKSFKDAGVLLGDHGYLSYYTPTASSLQEQRIPIYIAGFYDPGIIPIGGKLVLANQELTTLLRAAYQQDDQGMGTGINVRFDNIDQAEKVKTALAQAFKKEGIERYWKVETFREFDFTKDIIQQLRSEKNLFTLIATVIIIVACSNIISMLIILVNDKKIEIGILRSMGATSASIAAIFGLCGVVMGLLGSLIGTLAAMITLKNLPLLIGFISRLQGYEMFNANMYGEVLPHELSYEALAFVLIATAIISLIAGIVPAVKASMLKPSAILKSE